MTTHNHDVLMAINSRIINGRSSGAKQLNADYRALVKARDEIIKLREKLAAQPVPVQEPVYLVEDDFGLFRITTKGDWNFYNITVPGVKKTLIANATPQAQIAPDDLDRNACEELNCAEEVLDGLSVDLDMEKTDFDCIGDYIKAVFAAQAKRLTPPAQPAMQNAFNAAIDFAIEEGSGAAVFLRCWREGDTSEWPEFDAAPEKGQP